MFKKMQQLHVIWLFIALLSTEKCCAEGEQGAPDILFPGWSMAGAGSDAKAAEPSNAAPADGQTAPPPAVSNSEQAANGASPQAQPQPPVPPGLPNGIDSVALMREHLLRQAAGHQHNQRPVPPHVPPYSAFEALNQHAAGAGHAHPHAHHHPHPHAHHHPHPHPHAHHHPQGEAMESDSDAQRRMLESFHSEEVQRRLREIEANYERERGGRDEQSHPGSIWYNAFSQLFGFGPRANGEGGQMQSEAQSLFFIPLLVAMVFAYFVFNCFRISSQWRDEETDDGGKKQKQKQKDVGLGGATRGLSEMIGPALLAALNTDKQKPPTPTSTQPQPQPQPQNSAGVCGSLLAKDVGNLSLEELIVLQQTLLSETLKRQQTPAASDSVPAPTASTSTSTSTSTASGDEGGLRKRVVPQAE